MEGKKILSSILLLGCILGMPEQAASAAPPSLSSPDTTPEDHPGPRYFGKTQGSGAVSVAGNAVYKIPVVLPPGTASMQPNLTLTYNSNMPNGHFGFGWFLQGMNSKVARCPKTLAQDGEIRVVDFSINDRFCLDGAKLQPTPGHYYGREEAEYRTEIDRSVRVISHGTRGGGPAYFTVEYPDGRIWYYGNTSDSFIESQNQDRARVWLLNRVVDASGNYMDFSYFEDRGEGEYRPMEVAYTGNTNTGMLPNIRVKLEYHTRPDSRVRYVSGNKITDFSKRVARLSVEMDGLELWSYHLDYEYFGVNTSSSPTGNHARLKSVKRCENSGSGGACQDAITINWWATESGTPLTTNARTVPSDVMNPEQNHRLRRWHDFNGDGTADYIHFHQRGSEFTGEYTVQLSNTGGPVVQSWSTYPVAIAHDKDVTWADINGDGRTDMLIASAVGSQTNFDIAFSTGSGFSVQAWTGYYNRADLKDVESDHFLFDMNGDKLLDLVVRVHDETQATQSTNCNGYVIHDAKRHIYSIDVALNTGSEFGPLENWKRDISFNADLHDMDGNGLVDLVEAAGIVHYNYGSGFFVSRSLGGMRPPKDCAGKQQYVGYSFLDANADGLTDIYAWNLLFLNDGYRYLGDPYAYDGLSVALVPLYNFLGDTNRHAYQYQLLGQPGKRYTNIDYYFNRDNTGSSRSVQSIPANDTTLFKFKEVADVDGDGIQEFTAKTTIPCNGGKRCETDQIHYWKSNNAPHHLIKKIISGRGFETEFSYKPLTDHRVYTKGVGAVLPIEDVQDSTYVVAAFRQSDGVGGDITINYQYEGLRRDHGGRGLMGYAKIAAENVTTDTKVVTHYRQDFPFSSKPKRIEVRRASDNQLLKDSQMNYGYHWTYGMKYISAYLRSRVEKKYSLEAADLISTTTTTNTVDVYGNVTGAEEVVIDHKNWSSRTRETARYYAHDVTNWRIKQLERVVEKYFVLGAHSPMLDRRHDYTYYPDTGLLHKTIQEQGSGDNFELTTTFIYDAWGNVEAKEVSGPAVSPGTETVIYDSRGQFPMAFRNPLLHQISRTYDARFGTVQSETDPNGQTTSWVYDRFGWQESETRPDYTSTEKRRYLDPSASVEYSEMYVESVSTGAPTQREFYDRLGRLLRKRTRSFSGSYVNVDTEYDPRGRIDRVSEPYFDGGSPAWNVYEYDTLDRPTELSAADSTQSWTREYQGLEILTTATDSRTTRQWSNAWGHIVRADDEVGTTTLFGYDAAGNRTRVVNDVGGSFENAVIYTYDRLGRQLTQNDPDHGLYTYTYDALGRRKTEISPKMARLGQKAEFFYDVIGRMQSRVDPDGTTIWTYDNAVAGNLGIGKLHKESLGTFSKTHVYAPEGFGRLTSLETRIDGTSYTSSLTYNRQGKVATETYPSNFVIESAYNPLGFLERVQEPAGGPVHYQLLDTDAAGRQTKEWLGDGSLTAMSYDGSSGRLSEQHATLGGSAIQYYSYQYDNRGSLLSRTDRVHALTESFTYDDLDQLASAAVGDSPPVQYGFNSIGNMTVKSDLGETLVYDHPTAVHALTGVFSGSAVARIYYDANGNLDDGDDVPAITWSSYNKPIQLTKHGITYNFEYGPDRLRFKKIKGGQVTRYINNHYEKITHSWLWGERHMVRAYGRPILRRDTFLGTPVLKYIHQDHLGSTTLLTSDTGAVLERFSFDAWGKRRDPLDWVSTVAGTNEPRGYTGHEHLDDIGLIHMNGRVYEPDTGRMLSPDPFVRSVLAGLDYNRYSYALNNPLKYYDPTGHIEEVVVTAPAFSATGTTYYNFVGSHEQDQFFAANLIHNLGEVGNGVGRSLGYLNIWCQSSQYCSDLTSQVEDPYDRFAATINIWGSLKNIYGDDFDIFAGGDDTAISLPQDVGQVDVVEGAGWLRPEGHPYVVGRDGNSIVWPGAQGPGIGSVVDDIVPAGHTFGTNHDAFVSFMTTNFSAPDALVNIPSMIPIYMYSVGQEAINTPFRVFDSLFGSDLTPFVHTHPEENRVD